MSHCHTAGPENEPGESTAGLVLRSSSETVGPPAPPCLPLSLLSVLFLTEGKKEKEKQTTQNKPDELLNTSEALYLPLPAHPLLWDPLSERHRYHSQNPPLNLHQYSLLPPETQLTDGENTHKPTALKSWEPKQYGPPKVSPGGPLLLPPFSISTSPLGPLWEHVT